MRIPITSVALILAVFTACPPLFSQSEFNEDLPELHTRSMRTLTIDDGFPTDCFTDVHIDYRGSMWMTACWETQNNREIRLVQYDGYQSTLHNLDYPAGSSIVMCDWIRDSLIIGTEARGQSVWQYDTKDGSIRKFSVDQGRGYIFHATVVDNRLYALGHADKQLTVYDLVNDSLISVASIPALINHRTQKPNDYTPRTLVVDESIYLLTRNAVLKFNTQPHAITSVPVDFNTTDATLILWRDDVYVVGRKEPEIFRVDGDTLAPVAILPEGWSVDRPVATPGSRLRFGRYVSADQSGNIVVNCLDDKDNNRSLLIDKNLNYWDFTSISGSFPDPFMGRLVGEDFRREFYNISNLVTLVEVAEDIGIKSIGFQPGRSLLPLEDGRVLARSEGKRELLAPDLSRFVQSTQDEILSIHIDLHPLEQTDQFIWGVRRDSLVLFDNDTKSWSRHFPTKAYLFAPFRDGVLAVGTRAIESYALYPEPSADTITSLPNPDRLGHLNEAIETKDGIWLAGSRGLWTLQPETGQIEEVTLPGYDRLHVLCMTLLADNRIALGTESNGVLIFDPTTNGLHSINTDAGLSHNTVAGIIEDNHGHLWVNTFKGVSVIDDGPKVIRKFYQEDGLANNEGNRYSSYKHSDGRIIFGSIRGYSVIDPQLALERSGDGRPITVFLSRISFGESGDLTSMQNPSLQARYVIPSSNRNLRIIAGLSDYSGRGLNTFDYKIDLRGYDWSALGATMPATLSNLPSGKYSVFIRGRNARGVPSSNMVEIKLDVRKPFTRTAWFFLLLALPVIISLILWYVRSRRERQRLEKEVKSRTADIERQAEELRQMDKMKSRIYTNITHEFRTPLTVIKGATERSNGSANSDAIIRRNTDRLLNLVNQMLDLSKLESGTLEAKFVSGNVVDVTRDIFDSFSPLADAKDIGLHFYAQPDSITMDYDVNVLFRIIGNLMSNALKYTPAGGNVYVDLRQQDDILEVSVRDTGIGIAPDKIDMIFDRFYQVDDSLTRAGEGTGVGLSLTKELVEFLGGNIVSSE